MIQNIKNEIHRGIEELFAVAAVDELARDSAGYLVRLEQIAKIAEILGIDTTLTVWSLDLKTGD